MAKTLNLLALDLGAESGRAILGRFDGQTISLSEAHRFGNTPVQLPTGLHWNVLSLWQEILAGIKAGLAAGEGQLAGLGIDTWGVDFGLLDRQDQLIGLPYHYRDPRTDGMFDVAFETAGRAEIFYATGIQFMPINTLYQLLAMVQQKSTALETAQTYLMMPDLFNFWLTGRKGVEFSNATTSQCYNPTTGTWAVNLLQQLSIPTHIFPEIIPPATVLGPLQSAVTTTLDVPPIPVIAPACHDTGSAVVGVPADNEHFAYLSSGTWSLLGAETRQPIINEQSLAASMTNEGGVSNTFRFLKNIMGLWLVQECRRTWARQGREYSYAELSDLAAAATPFQAVINVDEPEFLPPGDMPARIQAYVERTNQHLPNDPGSMIRAVLEGLALKYRYVLERLEDNLGHRLDPIHIVGGGTQNQLLNQFAADATNRRVVIGPVEATAAGNLIAQLMALGEVASLAEGRQIVGRSFDIQTLTPGDRSGWDEAYARLTTELAA